MHALVAQVNKGGGPGGPPLAPGDELTIILALLCFVGLLLAGLLVLKVLFLLSMSRCFREISPQNRKMEPGMVWLCLIPFFDMAWTIIMMLRLAESLDLEYEDRDLPPDGDFGKTLAIVHTVLVFVGGLVSVVVLIMYWLKIAEYTRTLRQNPLYFHDAEDNRDRPSPRKRSRADDVRPRDREDW
jgi:hypothetical protein